MSSKESDERPPVSNGRDDECSLDRTFVYQNKLTGQPSTVTLSTRQLCRILCPTSSGNAVVVGRNIQGTTLVLGFDPSTGKYDEKGWMPANQVPVLKEACSQWYYCSTEQQQKVEGPVSCNEMEKLIKEGSIDPTTTKVVSAATENKWRFLREAMCLLSALDAFDTPQTPPSLHIKKLSTGKTAKITSAPENALESQQQQYDECLMTFDADTQNGPKDETATGKEKEIQDELEAFLSSTTGDSHIREEEEEEYVSDGGTVYGKCPRTGNWVHSDLIAMAPATQHKRPASSAKPQDAVPKTKKRKKPKFAAKNAKCWVYVTGLPNDCSEAEVAKFFSRVGILDLNPETQAPKIKLYRDKKNGGGLKGDASVCFARPESVDLAINILDETPFRIETPNDHLVKIQQAKFEQHGDVFERKGAISNAKRKVAKLAAIQAMDWDDEGANGRISGGRKGLCIIVLKHMFDPSLLDEKREDETLHRLEREVKQTCEAWGTVEKITVFSKHPEGVVIVKFSQPTAASEAIKEYSGKVRNIGSKVNIEASFWDGVTDYTVRDEAREKQEEEKRIDEFGSWLENQEIPDELKLQVEAS